MHVANVASSETPVLLHIGKEVDRKWKEGDDLDAMRQAPIEYTRKASRSPREPLMQPSLSLSQSVKKIGIRKLIRQGFGRRIIEKLSRREPVKASTCREYDGVSRSMRGEDDERSILCNRENELIEFVGKTKVS